MITQLTAYDFIFHLVVSSPMYCEALTTLKMASRATAARARGSKHQSNHCRIGQMSNAKLEMIYELICWCFSSYLKVQHINEKAFGLCSFILREGIDLWYEWHNTTRGLMYGYLIMYPSTNLPRCVMPFRSQVHAFCSYEHRDRNRGTIAAQTTVDSILDTKPQCITVTSGHLT